MRPVPGIGWLPALALPLLLGACSAGPSPTPPPACPTVAPTPAAAEDIIRDTSALEVRTSKGSFTIELEPDSAPIATANFVALARCGFYDGISFHRIVADFVAQAGDPQTRTNRADFEGLGSGGPDYHFDIELPPDTTTYRTYMVAMANAMQYDFTTGEIQGGTDTNGSQFFVMLDDVASLRPYYSLLGHVTAGTDVVDTIGRVPTSGGQRNVPLDPVIIESMTPTGSPGAS